MQNLLVDTRMGTVGTAVKVWNVLRKSFISAPPPPTHFQMELPSANVPHPLHYIEGILIVVDSLVRNVSHFKLVGNK